MLSVPHYLIIYNCCLSSSLVHLLIIIRVLLCACACSANVIEGGGREGRSRGERERETKDFKRHYQKVATGDLIVEWIQ
jgi:hypothetical protein